MFEQPSTETAQPIAAGSPEFVEHTVGNYEQSTRPQYGRALKRLRQNFASRGLAESGMAGMGELGLEQQRMADLSQVGERVALRGAEREQDRGWQVEDRLWKGEQLRKEMEETNRRHDRNQASELLGGLFKAGGTVLGGFLGPMGAAGGAAAGAGAADALFPPELEPSYDEDTALNAETARMLGYI